jgi:LmbE family N-acetylglucosaminyl deacetylase
LPDDNEKSSEEHGFMTEETPKTDGWRPDRFMVIVAHPDDADFGPAATAAAWIDAGSEGWLVCCTSGDAGSEDPNLNPLELARAREEEQREAAKIVGYAGVSFLHQPDGALVNDLPLREMLVKEIRTFRPDAVICGDPEVVIHNGGGINHTDHRAAGMAAVDAVYPAARNPMAFPWLAKSGLAIHKVRRLYLVWSNQPNTWLDVTATVDRKIAALRCHASQIHDAEAVFNRVRTRMADAGARLGVAAAEPYRVVVIDQDPAPANLPADRSAAAL